MAGGTSASKSTKEVPDTQWPLPRTKRSDQREYLSNCHWCLECLKAVEKGSVRGSQWGSEGGARHQEGLSMSQLLQLQSILVTSSQGLTQNHTTQQTSCKTFIGEGYKMTASKCGWRQQQTRLWWWAWGWRKWVWCTCLEKYGENNNCGKMSHWPLVMIGPLALNHWGKVGGWWEYLVLEYGWFLAD